MKVYNLTVLLEGKPDFAVPKEGVTAPEVYILKALHGEESVIDVAEAEPADEGPVAERLAFTKSQMRAWLSETYGEALRSAKTSLENVIGPTTQALPVAVEGAEHLRSTKRRKAVETLAPVDPSTVAPIEGIE